jgi:hypothetical protein
MLFGAISAFLGMALHDGIAALLPGRYAALFPRPPVGLLALVVLLPWMGILFAAIHAPIFAIFYRMRADYALIIPYSLAASLAAGGAMYRILLWVPEGLLQRFSWSPNDRILMFACVLSASLLAGYLIARFFYAVYPRGDWYLFNYSQKDSRFE